MSLPSLTVGAGTVTNATPYYSQERPTWVIVAISMQTGGAFYLTGIEQWSTSESDKPDAGTFSFSGPLADPNNLSYLQVAGPMDVIAIYGTRAYTVGADQAEVAADTLPQPGTLPITGWGNSANTGVRPMLDLTSLVFIGMVDTVNESYAFGDGGAQAELTVAGRDLTKVLIDNDVVIPFDQGSSANFLQRAFVIGINAKSSLQSIITQQLLDGFVSRSSTTQALVPSPESSALVFPWRQFISTKVADTATPYYAYTAGNQALQSWTVQTGSAWANATELANEPQTRLYVSEDGEIIIDDRLVAMTTQPVQLTIIPQSIVNVTFTEDDGSVATFISLTSSLSGTGALQQVLGGIGNSTSFIPGQAVPNYTPEVTVQRYGVRQTQFQSLWDTLINDDPQRLKLIKLLQLLHNSLQMATVTVKGEPNYRVGTRVKLAFNGARANVSNAVWYVSDVSHSADLNNGWLTTLSLRVPQPI